LLNIIELSRSSSVVGANVQVVANLDFRWTKCRETKKHFTAKNIAALHGHNFTFHHGLPRKETAPMN
jgi:hypothetical protein